MAASTLLWIYHNDPAYLNAHELSFTIRQHVMVNYHNKRAKRVQETQVAGKPRPVTTQTKDGTTRAEQIAVNPRDVSPLKPSRTHLHVAYFPPPAPGLINDEHRSIYNAIWWHRYTPLGLPEQDKMDWIQKCRFEASELLWHLAKEDKTFFEIFMCFSAAKEIAVKGSRDLRAYFRHKGRAISMVSQDVNRELHPPSRNSEMLNLA
jgi:hypothetical protein